MFSSAIKLRRSQPDVERPIRIKGLALIASDRHPRGAVGDRARADAAGWLHRRLGGPYAAIVAVGVVVLAIPAQLLYKFRRPEWASIDEAEVRGARGRGLARTSIRHPSREGNQRDHALIDLATYTPMGDKKNSDFFEEYLPRVYQRRQESGLDADRRQHGGVRRPGRARRRDQLHGRARRDGAVPVPGGPAHRYAQGLRPAVAAGVPADDRAGAADGDVRGRDHPVEHAVPAGPQEAERPLHRRDLQGAESRRPFATRSSRRTSASPTRATPSTASTRWST